MSQSILVLAFITVIFCLLALAVILIGRKTSKPTNSDNLLTSTEIYENLINSKTSNDIAESFLNLTSGGQSHGK